MFNRVRRFAAPVLRQATRGISTAPAARVSAFKYAYAAGAAGAAAGALWLTQEKPALADCATTTEKFATYWPRKIMILFGKPGAGKGSQGPAIEELLGIPVLSTGDMLRAISSSGSDFGNELKTIMNTGGLVSDEIVVKVIQERIQAADCRLGFVLDGFPRTLEQAKATDAMLRANGECVNSVIELDVPNSVLEKRITGRWIHKKSGRSYHVSNKPPQSYLKAGLFGSVAPSAENMKDDVTGEDLYQRGDDTAEALGNRLATYESKTYPILEHYAPFGIVKKVNGNVAFDQVWEEVLKSLSTN